MPFDTRIRNRKVFGCVSSQLLVYQQMTHIQAGEKASGVLKVQDFCCAFGGIVASAEGRRAKNASGAREFKKIAGFLSSLVTRRCSNLQ